MENKFKVGDRVKRINYDNGNIKVGNCYTIIGFTPWGTLQFLLLNEKVSGSSDGSAPCNFELVKEEEQDKGLGKSAFGSFLTDAVVGHVINNLYNYPLNIIKDKEETKMEIEKMSSKNVAEAKEQYIEEKNNAEVIEAKRLLIESINFLDSSDRKRRELDEADKPHEERLKKLGFKRVR